MEKEIMNLTEGQTIISSIKNSNSEIFCSFEATTEEDRKLLYNASMSGTSIKEVKNKTINLMDVIIMPVDVTNEDGTTSVVPRVALISVEGEIFVGTSWGMYNSLKRIQAIYGTLHFDNGLKISPIDVPTKKGSTITIKLI